MSETTVAIGYIRTSTDRQDLSPMAQREAIQRAADYRNWQVIWLEDTCSGSTPLAKRRAGKKALALLEAGAADKFVAAKFDRFTRSMRDLVDVIELAHRQHWGLVMLDFEGLDTSTSTGRLMAHVIVAVAQFERERIGERITDALRAKRSGEPDWTPGPIRRHPEPTGLIMDLIDAGHSPQAVADHLNRSGVPTVTGRGRWHHTSVRNAVHRIDPTAV